MLKIVTIVGARPQFIKAAAITRLSRETFKDQIIEIMVHTGQHFDKNMSDIFFEELEIPEPKYNLEISGGQHGAMTGRMLEAIEEVLLVEKPDWVLIYGDTNSTLAGAIAASKLHIPVAHVEAGLRSFNMRMPEELNRIIADRVSNLLLCPTITSVENLKKESLFAGVHLVGDVMYDVSLFYRKRAMERSSILRKLGLHDGNYVLTTCHRAENTDDAKRLKGIVDALARISEDMPVVFPIHPRTQKQLVKYNLQDHLHKVTLVDPLPYMDMVRLEQTAKAILTDSGGVQKEAFFYGVPCVTMRDETEWIETVDTGWNTLTGADTEAISQAFLASNTPPQRTGITPYGEGNASELCLKAILQAHTTC
jgi:UDP-GlcNAc3NAcA epimerase